SGARTSCRVMTSAAVVASQLAMPLRAAARRPLTLTVARVKVMPISMSAGPDDRDAGTPAVAASRGGAPRTALRAHGRRARTGGRAALPAPPGCQASEVSGLDAGGVLGRLDDVVDQQRAGHGAEAAGVGADPRGDLGDGRVHVAHEL